LQEINTFPEVRLVIYFLDKVFVFLLDAVKFSFENHYSKVFKNYDNHKWRVERYYNEPVDNVIKAYLPIFDGVFRSNASMKEIGKKE
jgi:hypothetical protein